MSDKMREALEYVREALQLANDSPNGGISDTIWMPHTPQTLFDFIDEALAQQSVAGELTARDMPDWPVRDSELAGKIMTLLGHAVSPSLEPGADLMRDRIAAMLAASQPEVRNVD